jgi:hypothetical protein
LTDYELFDGDPLVLFVAFSVGVTWILFLLPLAMGLTTAGMGPRLGVLAGEMAALVAFLTFSFVVRNQQIGRLKPYLTREERLWPVLGWVVFALYWVATGVILVAWLSRDLPSVASLPLWSLWHVPTEHDPHKTPTQMPTQLMPKGPISTAAADCRTLQQQRLA